MRLLSLLEAERKSGAFWYEILRQSPYCEREYNPVCTGQVNRSRTLSNYRPGFADLYHEKRLAIALAQVNVNSHSRP